MCERLGPPPSSACFPLWAWFQWEGTDRRRPDLRCAGHLPPGEIGVLVEFHADASEALLSDFELWHYVLNYQYLPSTMEDSARFDAVLEALGSRTPSEVAIRNRSFHSDLRESWTRIFDMHWSQPDIASHFTQKAIQATLWSLSRDRVRDFTVFRAR